MEIQNINRWAWMIIGIIVGMIMGYSWSAMGGYVEGIGTTNPDDFERDIVLKDKDGGMLIRRVVIRPAEYSPATKESVNMVTYERLAQDKNGNQWWIPKRFVAAIPYKPALGGRVEATPDLTIEKFLTTLAQGNPDLKFHNGWWYIPKYAMLLGAAGGFVIVGGIWPTLISLMVGAGFGGKQTKGKGDSLWNVKNTDTSKKESPQPKVTAADQQRLQEVTDAYAQNLGDAGLGMTSSGTAGPQSEAEIRKLEASKLEKAAEIKRPGDDDEIEVKGEYYPVLIHHHKKKPEVPPPDPNAPPQP